MPTRSTLPYEMGNAGDLLKHGVIAEFVLWRRAQRAPIRFLDLFGGEPFDDGVPDEVVRRVTALKDFALYELQSDISWGRYYGSGKLVQRLAERESDSLISVFVADRDDQRRKRLRESELRMLSEAFSDVDIESYDAYEALGSIVSGSRAGDLVLIDPFHRFLPDHSSRVISQLAKIARTGTVILFALNLDPFNAVGRAFDQDLERHFGDALIMTMPPLGGTSIKGESKYYVDLVLAGPDTDGDGASAAVFRRRLDDFSGNLATALDLSSRAASMLRPRVIGERFNGYERNRSGRITGHDQAQLETASNTGPSEQTGRPRKHLSNDLPHTAYGVDGCGEGWFYVELKPSEEIGWGVVKSIEELVASAYDPAYIFIDIPIGLPDDGKDRACDRAARKALGKPRASSVFPAPARALLDIDLAPYTYRGAYQRANSISKEKLGNGISSQTFAILPKIKEVDALLRRSAKAKGLIHEVHPELCFWALNGKSAMRFRKKKKEGFRERLDVLERHRPSAPAEVQDMIRWARGRGVARDDVLDALVAAITAAQPQETWRKFRGDHSNDRFGLPMEMVYVSC